MNNKIVRNCDKCNKEDSINSHSGLCVSCENKEKDQEFKELQKENSQTRESIAKLTKNLKPEKQDILFKLINSLINNEVAQEKLCNI